MTDLKNTYTYGRYNDYNVYTSNMTLGCVYPSQIGPYDILPGKIYIIEYNNADGKEIEISLQINSYVESNIYLTLSIIFGSILSAILGIFVQIAMYFLYKIWCIKNQEYELANDINDTL